MAGRGTVYVVAGSSGWATGESHRHPAMFFNELQLGSMVIDIDGNRLDAKFLRETGEIDDWFTLIKSTPREPLWLAGFSVSNDSVIARWVSIEGHTYQLQSAPHLGSAPWTNVGSVVNATGSYTSSTNSPSEGNGRGFYRVVDVSD